MRPRQVARILAGVIVFLICITWLDSPLRPSAARRLQMLGFAPQSWGFFAEPREQRTEVFRLRKGTWERADSPLGSAANLFGLRRSIVNYGAEFRSLESQIGARWSTADLTEKQLPDTSPESLAVTNLAHAPRLCGEVLLVSRPPLPWAWARAGARTAVPTRYVRLRVQC
jgi:antimicrobial peptide system SdpA family protein